jgi:hypothetical protein
MNKYVYAFVAAFLIIVAGTAVGLGVSAMGQSNQPAEPGPPPADFVEPPRPTGYCPVFTSEDGVETYSAIPCDQIPQ